MRASIPELLCGCALVAALSGCAEQVPPPKARPAVPVVVAAAARRDVPVEARVVGTVEPYTTVAMRSLVSAELRTIHFKEGSDVREGDPLFTLDMRHFQSDLRRAEANLARDLAAGRQAEANLARDAALLRNAESEARRYEQLVRDGIVSRGEYDRFRTTADSAAATVRADQAAIENNQESVRADRAAIETARLQLGYCRITAPISGRTGALLVNAGNLVRANDTVLVSINQVAPLYVGFALPEQLLGDVKRYMAKQTLKVAALPPGEEDRPSTGDLAFVNNAVDSTTGTIRLKAQFANADRRLWPGQFVNVVLTLTTQPGAVLVPSHAVQTGQAGTYVFLVRPDQTVEIRPVVSPRTVGGDAIIDRGLEEGDRVVTDGQLRLTPGARVEIKAVPEAAQGGRP